MLVALITTLVLAGAGEAQEAGSTSEQAKNVIIFIGDGMGTSHRDLIRYATVGTAGQLAMDSMPYAGRSETGPLDPEAFVTDSAAGGTATMVLTFAPSIFVVLLGASTAGAAPDKRSTTNSTALNIGHYK